MATEAGSNGATPNVTGKNLYQRLAMVKQAIGHVGKTAQAPAVMGGFMFVPWEAVADRLGDILAEHGLVQLPSMPEYSVAETADKVGQAQKTNYRTTVKLRLTLVNADDPAERETLEWWGVGDDTSDKGLQKGGTNGTKYLLMKLFMLGGLGGADDSDGTPPADTGARSAPRAKAAPPSPVARVQAAGMTVAATDGNGIAPPACPECGMSLMQKTDKKGEPWVACTSWRSADNPGCGFRQFRTTLEKMAAGARLPHMSDERVAADQAGQEAAGHASDALVLLTSLVDAADLATAREAFAAAHQLVHFKVVGGRPVADTAGMTEAQAQAVIDKLSVPF